MSSDPHTTLYEANSALKCLAALVGGQDDQLESINGWGLCCLLRLVSDRLNEVVEQLGGDPDAGRDEVLTLGPGG